MDRYYHNTPAHHQSSQPVVEHVSHQTTHHTTPIYTDNKPTVRFFFYFFIFLFFILFLKGKFSTSTREVLTVRFFSKVKSDYSVTIRDGHVVLAPTNPSDHHQHWIKEKKFSRRVKDEEGFPSFALVNKATGQAIKHAIGSDHPVQLVEYNQDKLDESVLWTESKDLGDGYHAFRMVNNIKLNIDAWNADKDHGGVRDGTELYLFKWTEDDNQRWTTAPFRNSRAMH
ncbi:ricin B-like lectin R40G3 [Rutidosis leptorrhynchoides]|uniref:ricin B-like lectin R40G3 n=1 Tax=Rutidosis leptorrhynchoides TaxID=125765 RepID=UPI003A9926FA